MFKVSDLQVALLQKSITVLIAPRFGQKVVVRDLLRISDFIFLDLVEVDALSKFVGLTKSDYGDSVLAREVRNHRRTDIRDHSSVAKHVAHSQEDLGSLSDKRADTLNKRILAVNSIVAQSLR